MIRIDGVEHQTIKDAAARLGVSVKTVKSYIDKGIIASPPTEYYGLRHVQVFPDDYLARAQNDINIYRQNRNG